LAAFDQYRDDGVQYFDCMFALATWDEQAQRLFLARDRFGEKPFFYHFNKDHFVFASEMKALWAAGIERKANLQMLFNYITIGYVDNPERPEKTFFEKDLKEEIFHDLKTFKLELGKGFTFVKRQKRMIIDGEDFNLDLLFYHRKLKRLVAIELKLGKFQAKHKGQMELYLKWLDKYEKQEGESTPIGLILCAESSREQIELLEMHKDGIMVAEYWTDLPPKKQFEEKIHSLLAEAKERIERKKLF